MQKRGLFFVGIDVIGGKLTEVNVTSPTGVQEIDRLDARKGRDRLVAQIHDAIEKKLAAADDATKAKTKNTKSLKQSSRAVQGKKARVRNR